jgi:hypothetical protein
MIVAIHQPNFIPWSGYFFKILKADVFVLLDDVQFTKNSFINRNRIKTPEGAQWITLPVLQSGNFGQKINQIELFNSKLYFKKIKGTLNANYRKAPFFDEVFELINPTLIDANKLVSVNELIIKNICKYLNIKKEIINSSSLTSISGESTDRLVSICKHIKATDYLAGFGSKNYQDNLKFNEAGINPLVYEFKHPVYNQLWGDFIPNLSIVDLLFNHGKKSLDYLI